MQNVNDKTIQEFSNRHFVVEQNLTGPKDDFWSYLNHPCEIAVVWDNQMTANMDPSYYSDMYLK